jgi:hypothetical protein
MLHITHDSTQSGFSGAVSGFGIVRIRRDSPDRIFCTTESLTPTLKFGIMYVGHEDPGGPAQERRKDTNIRLLHSFIHLLATHTLLSIAISIKVAVKRA